MSNLKIVVDDIMERMISVYIEANDEKMEQQLITQNVYRIVKRNNTTSSISHQEEWALNLSTLRY